MPEQNREKQPREQTRGCFLAVKNDGARSLEEPAPARQKQERKKCIASGDKRTFQLKWPWNWEVSDLFIPEKAAEPVCGYMRQM